MSPWLLKRFSSKTLFFSELLAVSTIIHVVIGLALFVLYRGQYESFSFEVHSKFNPDAPVLFLHHRGSLHSTRNGLHRNGQGVHAKSRSNAMLSKNSAKHSGKNASVQPKQTVAHANNAKIAEKTATMFLDKTKKPKIESKKNKKQKAQSLKVAADEPQKTPAAVVPQTLQPEGEKKIVEKVAQRQEPAIKEPPMPEHVQENNAQEAQAESSGKESTSDVGTELSLPESFDVAIGSEGIGDAGDDQEYSGLSPEAARIYYAVQEEITTRWKPPMGLPKDLVCTISVRLDREGTIANIAVKKSSGVLIYDMAASQAAQEMKLPQIAWGKEFSIAFKL